jgi:phosphoribosylaminoimidazole-succinocarboxamide synthase
VSRPEPFVEVDLPLPDCHRGKVRVSYALGDGRRLFITTDRISALDRVIGGVLGKGQILNQLAWWWFAETADVIANHTIAQPDPNALVAVQATPLPVEVVVRGRLTGSTSTSLWPRYAAGERELYGYRLPDGLTQHGELPRPIVTPTTKAHDGGHDEPIAPDDVVGKGLVDAARWADVMAAALALFARGQAVAERAGLILADTKYEFGVTADGSLILIDEVHTPDSSRFWVEGTLEDRLAAGLDPESLDKEPTRLALAATGYRGDGPPPRLADEVWQHTHDRYVRAYERITGSPFVLGEQPVLPRLVRNLTEAGLL